MISNNVLNLNHLACYVVFHRHGIEQMKWILAPMTTKASLRSICLNDLYRHKNL